MKYIRLSDDNYELISLLAKSEGRTRQNMLDRIVQIAGMNWDDVAKQDRINSELVRAHIVNEGVDLGILPETTRVIIPKTK